MATKTIKVYVPCEDASGMPVIVRANVITDDDGIENGLHYDAAEEIVESHGYTAGRPKFDEQDIGNTVEHWDSISTLLDD